MPSPRSPSTLNTLKSVLAVCATATVLSAVPAHAQDVTHEIDEIFAWATSDAPGCAVAVSHRGDVVADAAYGLANLDLGTPITPATKFDVGSLQKQFISAVVLLLVEEGRISLDQDIRELIPELPDYGHTITIDHLLTHTSGIRDWNALLGMSSESEPALTMILRQPSLNHAPGEEFSYSNSNYVLAKEIVARSTGMPFSALVQERILEPLGMEMTTYADDVRDVEHRALAYEKDGAGWRLHILVGDERGDGGALLSTAADLLIWNDALHNARLGPFVTQKLHEPATLNNGRELSHTRGLYLTEDPASTIIWYTGAAAGYKSALARLPDQGLSLAVLCNAGESAVAADFMNPIVDLFVPKPAEVDGDAPSSATEAELSDKAGLFFSEADGAPLRLVVQDGALRVEGGPALVPIAEDRFRNADRRLSFMSDADVELHFVSPDELIATTTEGESTLYRRAQPIALDSEQLESFAGRYHSDELNAVFDVMSASNGVLISLNGSPPLPFALVDRDTFQLRRSIVRFDRDADGRVVALEYSNPSLRRVPFFKAADAALSSDPEMPGNAPETDATRSAESAAEFTRFVGDYALQLDQGTRNLRVFVSDGQPMAELEGEGISRLLPRGERTFVAAVDEEFRFTFSAEDPAQHVTLYLNGREIPGLRMSP